MKNKFGIAAAAVLVALSLSACSNNSQNQSSSSSSNKASSSKVEKKESSSSKPSSQAPKENRMRDLTAKLRKALPSMLLPTKDGLGQGSNNLNVRYTKSANTNVVYYSVGSSAQGFNASGVKSEKPYAVLTEKKNLSSDDITDFINYMPEQSGLPTKKLDANTKATSQGAAGSTYVQFNKNGYSFVIQANNQRKQNPVKRAKSVLALFKQYGLPKTAKNGSVQVKIGDSVGSLNTVISWQDGNNVYQLKAHVTTTAFKMLASLK